MIDAGYSNTLSISSGSFIRRVVESSIIYQVSCSHVSSITLKVGRDDWVSHIGRRTSHRNGKGTMFE